MIKRRARSGGSTAFSDFPRHKFPTAGTPPASIAVAPFSDASQISVDDEIFTNRVQRTLRRTTKMEAQRSDFRKGKTCFELESIFVYSASPLSDVNVALDNQDHRAGRVRRGCVPRRVQHRRRRCARQHWSEEAEPHHVCSIWWGQRRYNEESITSFPNTEAPTRSDSTATLPQKKLPFPSIYLIDLYRVHRVSSISPSFSFLLPLLLDTGVANCGESSADTTCGVGILAFCLLSPSTSRPLSSVYSPLQRREWSHVPLHL
ncbi:hypothetical protein BLNAU_21333 [Blattamonas nauphoetae]|uniref:Uncharacterized protein n=1 Tax=Blattamonas nauphoetae TaxID=2049346 RepID=A0ABQ9WW40_9EUKA|nr:hypothetical protein BLNAU_21333 [Blattamonas nauphoetae]